MARKKPSISGELRKIVRKNVETPYLEKLGVLPDEKEGVSVLRAIALAQVKKGLEGDLKAAEFIEELLSKEDEKEKAPEKEALDVVVRVVGAEDGN